MRIIFSFIFLFCCLIAVAFFANEQLKGWSETGLKLGSQEVLVDIPRGTSLKDLSVLLEEKRVVSSANWFRIWVRLYSSYSEFQAGPYRFIESVSPQEIANTIRAGEIYQPIVLEVTIPEGFLLSQIIERFIAAGVGKKADFEGLVLNRKFLDSHNIPGKSIEGFFYPATYRFYKQPTAKDVLEKGIGVFFEKLPINFEAKVKELGLSLYEAVVFASLIELETKYDDERSKVSEVIWGRLNDGVALAIDASIIYGIEDYSGNLSRKHLRDRSNLYNTRVHKGLPPTPIGAPSIKSLLAILSPTNEGYYYYVIDPDKGDRHHFSKSLREHNTWVRKLVKSQRIARRKRIAEQRLERLEGRRKRSVEK